jgi:hypothetical protein
LILVNKQSTGGTDIVLTRLTEAPVESPTKKLNNKGRDKGQDKGHGQRVWVDVYGATGLSRGGRRSRNPYCVVRWDMHEVTRTGERRGEGCE